MKRKYMLNTVWGTWPVVVMLLLASPLSANVRSLPKDMDGRSIDPFVAVETEAIVFVFVAAECPIANRYIPRVNRFAAQYGPEGISFFSVYADEELSVESILKHRKDYSIEIPALKDDEKWLVAKTGVAVTPEVAVYLRSDSSIYEPVYRGRIDDQYQEFGKWRREPNQKDFEEVLEAIVKGEVPSFRKTRAIGCYIGE